VITYLTSGFMFILFYVISTLFREVNENVVYLHRHNNAIRTGRERIMTLNLSVADHPLLYVAQSLRKRGRFCPIQVVYMRMCASVHMCVYVRVSVSPFSERLERTRRIFRAHANRFILHEKGTGQSQQK
jgi:hypothetical protein